MTSVCLVFEVHQPQRLRRINAFDTQDRYFDDARNGEICRKVADKCYRPATRLFLELVRKHKGDFRLAFSITGTAIEQFEEHCPDVLDLFRELVKTGHCELLAETYYHSLAFVYDRGEFAEQVELHARAMERIFGISPRVFRNTELVYSNELAAFLAAQTDDEGRARYAGVLAEGVDRFLDGRSPGQVFHPPGRPLARGGRPLGVLLKNYRLSDDIAFRFGDRNWEHYPLKPAAFADWIGGGDAICNLFMDYETIGEHQWAETGIFDFFGELPERVLAAGHRFVTPAGALSELPAAAVYDVPAWTSWADTERDLSAWRGNAMQTEILERTFAIGRAVRQRALEARQAGDPEETLAADRLLADWRRLTTSDHAYYMSTKGAADGAVHQYFSPFESPYEAYMAFANALDRVALRAGA